MDKKEVGKKVGEAEIKGQKVEVHETTLPGMDKPIFYLVKNGYSKDLSKEDHEGIQALMQSWKKNFGSEVGTPNPAEDYKDNCHFVTFKKSGVQGLPSHAWLARLSPKENVQKYNEHYGDPVLLILNQFFEEQKGDIIIPANQGMPPKVFSTAIQTELKKQLTEEPDLLEAGDVAVFWIKSPDTGLDDAFHSGVIEKVNGELHLISKLGELPTAPLPLWYVLWFYLESGKLPDMKIKMYKKKPAQGASELK
ncbi:hypothetical protein IPG41_04680 [Candidatus Peregrinibacteria bacterium]|nr:MAG: hypothetical protein IPG41_04680 [Candidatus Peregrinibacteria bacterium]